MPLSEIRVVDLTRILAGPFATMILGDMGAEVIKIERPGTGDDTRGWGPPFVDGTSTYFIAVNRNKRSVTLDLKTDRGREILWSLIETADVVVSNFRAGVMERLGFGWEEVSGRAPRCVYAVINGYGTRGRRSERPSFDVVVQAETGLMDLTGHPDGPPTKVGASIADEVSGLYLVQGILLALRERDRSGRGQRVEVALHDALLSLFTYQAQMWLSSDERPRRMGNRHPSIVPYETYETADGTLVVGCGNERIWERLCEAIGRPDLLDDPDYATNADRLQNRASLEPELGEVFATGTVEDWEARLTRAGVPCGRVRRLPDVLDREREEDREMIVPVPGAGIELLGVPIKLSATPGRVRSAPPTLGEHTAEVLASLGIDEQEVATLRDEGVV